MVSTFDDLLGVLIFEISEDAKTTLASATSVTTSASYSLSNQKFFIFNEREAMNYRAVPGFIALNSQLFGYGEQWGFLLNTDENELRRTRLFQNTRFY